MTRKVMGVILAVLAFLLVYALFPNRWLLEVLGHDHAAWVGLSKLVCAGAAATGVHHRCSEYRTLKRRPFSQGKWLLSKTDCWFTKDRFGAE